MTTATELITEKQLGFLTELIKSVQSAPTGFDWQKKTALVPQFLLF